MNETMDPYAILGVSRDADADTIRRAYLKLAHKYHPDKTGGDKAAEDKLKEVNAAYDILKNPEKRAKYDRFGSTEAGGFEGFGGGFSGGAGPQGFEAPFEDFFDMLFGQGGGGRRRGGGAPGNDLELRVTISLLEAAQGVKREVRFNRAEVCSDCGGSGAAPGSRPEVCSQCNGAGQVRMAQGFFSISRTCPKCNGAGQVITKPCRRCHGNGRMKTSRTLSVNIPAGVDTGSRIRIAGEGEPGRGGGPRGDLHILIQVEPHEVFEREGPHLFCDLPISITQAALGATIRVPTLTSEAELKVPAGTQSGTQLRLRGLGMPDLRGYQHGDQIVRVTVETPTKLSRKQKDLLRQFEEASGEESYPLHKRFLGKAWQKK